jgi:hypothetical protein
MFFFFYWKTFAIIFNMDRWENGRMLPIDHKIDPVQQRVGVLQKEIENDGRDHREHCQVSQG